MMLNVD